MSALSDYAEAGILDAMLNGVALTFPTTTYVALYTTATDDAAGGTEVTGGSYARKLVNPSTGAAPKWVLADPDGAAHVVTNADDIEFVTATDDWGTITHIAIMDASTAGNRWLHGALTASQVVNSGGTFRILAGALKLRLA